MTAPDTDTLAGLLADASPGPWEWASIYRGDVHHLVHWVPGETFPNDDPRYIEIHSDGSAAGEYGPDIDVTGADARLIALAPELAAETIALRAQAAKDKARIERLEAALKGARALLRSGADLLSVESEALREGITVNGELRADPEDASTVEAIEEIEAWIADVGGFLNARAALEDGE